MVVVHTEVSKALRGRGVAGVLVEAALAEARHRGWQVEATCSYVARYLERHPPADRETG
jgi:predicted GNAT family acetyltransferase